MLSAGMLTAFASSMALRSRGFASGLPPPIRAAIAISLMSLVKSRPRLASAAPFLCLMVAHLLWPDMKAPDSAAWPIICGSKCPRMPYNLLVFPATQRPRMSKKLLLIEYDARSLERVRSLLSAEYEVVEARDGEEGLHVYSSSRFDLVLLSGMLPRLPSAEVIREIRRRGGATAPPIILMVAGYRGTNTKADAQRVGAFDLLARPFSDEALEKAAAEAIAATGVAARASRGETDAREISALTSSDIFSDILEEVAREGPGPAPASRITQATEAEVEKRLRDTLSGVLPKSPSASVKPPARSTDEEVERLIFQTLSGLRTPARQRTTPVPQPALQATAEPAVKAPETAPAGEVPGPDRFG